MFGDSSQLLRMLRLKEIKIDARKLRCRQLSLDGKKKNDFQYVPRKYSSYCLLRRVAHVFEIINDVNKNWHNAIAVILQTSATLMPKQKPCILLSGEQYLHMSNQIILDHIHLSTITHSNSPKCEPKFPNKF